MLWPQCQVSERYRQDVADCGGQPIEREVSWRSRGHGGRGQLSSLWMCGAADGRQSERWRCLGGQELPHGSPQRYRRGRPACVNTGRLWAGGAATACGETRSCGRGCKGYRDYERAWAATSSPRHQILIRPSLSDPADLAVCYCHAPEGRAVSLPVLIKVAGKRWPAGECFAHGKGQAGPDQHQVRLWHSFHRHTVLSMCARALLAIAAARPALPGSDPPASTAGQPTAWRDTGKLPASADDRPPGDDPGLVKVSVPEARRLAHPRQVFLHKPEFFLDRGLWLGGAHGGSSFSRMVNLIARRRRKRSAARGRRTRTVPRPRSRRCLPPGTDVPRGRPQRRGRATARPPPRR